MREVVGAREVLIESEEREKTLICLGEFEGVQAYEKSQRGCRNSKMSVDDYEEGTKLFEELQLTHELGVTGARKRYPAIAPGTSLSS